jgi:hypothetical protein
MVFQFNAVFHPLCEKVEPGVAGIEFTDISVNFSWDG